MKLIIDIPEVPLYRDMYTAICENGYIFDEDNEYIAKAIKKGTPIPDKCGKIYAEKDIREQIKNPYQCQTVLYGLELVKPIIKGESK